MESYGSKRERELFQVLHGPLLSVLVHQCDFEQEKDPVYASSISDAIYLRHPILPYILTSVSFYEDLQTSGTKMSFHTRVPLTGARDEEHHIRVERVVLRYMEQDLNLLVGECMKCADIVLKVLKGLKQVIVAKDEDLPRFAASPDSDSWQALIATNRLEDPDWLPYFMPRSFPGHLLVPSYRV